MPNCEKLNCPVRFRKCSAYTFGNWNVLVRYSDRPILRPGQDALGRANFSLALARAIDQLVIAQEGFVIAILGEWGSGKSSVIELILRFLTHLEMERASQTALLGDSEPLPQDITQIEELAIVFDKIRDQVSAYDNLNLNFPAAQRLYRLNLFQSWLRSDADAQSADWPAPGLVDTRLS
jgi:hypothetical protein